MDEWLKDLKRSAAVIQQSTPILQKMLNDPNLEIMQVESKDEEVCKMLDMTCGIDYFAIRHNGNVRGIAWRCQWVEPNREFNSFTVRKARKSGTPTEYEKRKAAMETNSIYPYYVVQAYANKNTNEILSLAITTTEDLFRYIEENNDVETRQTGKDQVGQAKFLVVYWSDMKTRGYRIRKYSKEFGIV